MKLLFNKDEDLYSLEFGYGRQGLFVTWCTPGTGLKPNILQGKINGASSLSVRIESLIKTLTKENKRYPSEYKLSDQIMGCY